VFAPKVDWASIEPPSRARTLPKAMSASSNGRSRDSTNGAIVERVEAAPIDRDQPVASSQRFFEPSHCEQRSHEDRQGLRRAGAELDGLAQQVVGFCEAASLIKNEAQQMQRIELARVAGEQGR
jgi:hypothetical protein